LPIILLHIVDGFLAMSDAIYVTGLGSVSCIGLNVEEHMRSLIEQKSGIHLGTKKYCSDSLVGEVPLTDRQLMDLCGWSKKASRTFLLACIAAKEALTYGLENKNNLFLEDYSLRSGIIVGTSVGGMDISEQEYRQFITSNTHTIAHYRHHPSGTIASQLAKLFFLNSYVDTVSTACSSAANAILIGARLIRASILDRVVVGGVDALTEFTLRGFQALGVYDKEWCKPFDNNRKGLNLGEGAGFIVLENEKSVRITQRKILAQLLGWGNAADAYHQTASSPYGTGAKLAMQEALKQAQIYPDQVDYINVHGTATPNNDLSESRALLDVFAEQLPAFSSTKAYTGHTLGAAGGIEAVISVLAIDSQSLPVQLNFQTPMEETNLKPLLQDKKDRKIRHVLSNSFGFGGNNTSLIFSNLS